MNRLCQILCAAAVLGFSATQVRAAEVKLQISGLHACCNACIADINTALNSVDGAKGAFDKAAKKAELTAKDEATATKALAALGDAGFHGTTDNKDFVMKDDSGATAGKVKTLTLTGIHNCCNGCVAGIQAAVKKTDGATLTGLKAHTTTFDVTGDFDAAALIKSLNDGGYHVKVKQ